MSVEMATDDFYRELTSRNRGFIDEGLQNKIRSAHVLIAGCGSIGGATVQPLARIGFTRFTLADSGEYEINNLNRQHALARHVGLNKAKVAAEYLHEINPSVVTEVHDEGITAANAEELVRQSDIIIDGVDVTTHDGLRAKVELHLAACANGKPLITGWDMAGMLCVQYFDYKKIDRIFDGQLAKSDLDRLSTWECVFRIAPRRYIPADMYDELRSGLRSTDYSVPQLTEAAAQFSSIAPRLAVQLIAGHKVPRVVAVDVHQRTRPLAQRLRATAAKPISFVRFANSLPLSSAWRGFAPKSLYGRLGS